MTPPAADASTRAVCARVTAALPQSVAGQDRRATTPQGPTAAWGDPPIVLRCGVPRPAALTPTSQLLTVDGVDWFAEPLTGGYLFTTYGREANVEVAVPAAYAPESGPLADLAAAVAASVPVSATP